MILIDERSDKVINLRNFTEMRIEKRDYLKSRITIYFEQETSVLDFKTEEETETAYKRIIAGLAEEKTNMSITE